MKSESASAAANLPTPTKKNGKNKNGKNKSLSPTAQKGISLESILGYRAMGMNGPEIARLLGCTKETIYWHLNRFKATIEAHKIVEPKKTNWLAMSHSRALLAYNSLSIEEQKGKEGVNIATQIGILADKERLYKGESTQNISVQQQIQHIENLDLAIQEAERKLSEFK